MEPYPSGQFGFIDDPERQFGNGSVWTRTRTRSDGPEPLLTLDMVEEVEQETATKVSAPMARLTATLQMHAGSGHAPGRVGTMEETTSPFVSSAGSQAMSKSIGSHITV